MKPGLLAFCIGLCSVLAPQVSAQTDGPPLPVHGQRPTRLVIRDVMVVPGNGTPAIGPTTVIVAGNRIERIGRYTGTPKADAFVDGAGRYVIPGLINMHGHIQESSAGIPMDPRYQMNLWLASGITSIRDLGSNFNHALELKKQSAAGDIVAPRIHIYPLMSKTPKVEDLVARMKDHASRGADGFKLFSLDREQLEAAAATAHELGLRTTTHMGVEDANALDVARVGLTSIEHWYGIPDAALEGVQNFPPEFSYSNEVHRFRYAGRLWRETVPERLELVLDELIQAGVAWDPTFAIYEASRDLIRAQNKPWFKDHLHPALKEFFEPSLSSHGSFFIGWTNRDEVYWKENYSIWMNAVRQFARRGGVITCGEDAGFIYVIYGFGLLRELELHEEAGFHPLEVIKQATFNGATVLGRSHELGLIKEGYLADLAIVNGNPLENLRVLYPTGCDRYENGKSVPSGTIEWTLKDGIPYHGPTLMKEVRQIVSEARTEAAKPK